MDIGGLVYAEQWTCLRLVEGSKRWQCWLMMELTRWSLLANDRWKRQWQWQIPGEDSRQVTDEKDDDSRDKNNREITISGLLVALRSRSLSEKILIWSPPEQLRAIIVDWIPITISLSIISINLLWKNRSSQFFQSPIDTSGFANWEEGNRWGILILYWGFLQNHLRNELNICEHNSIQRTVALMTLGLW